MDLSPVKIEILQSLLLQGEPAKAALIAQETGQKAAAVQMHLIGLVRAGLADSPEKGKYCISVKGKTALGLPVLAKDALTILAPPAKDKAFYFYVAIGKPLNIAALDPLDFAKKLEQISEDSLRFHLERGDFEAWFKALGDAELAKKIGLLKQRKLSAQELRERIRKIVEARWAELTALAAH